MRAEREKNKITISIERENRSLFVEGFRHFPKPCYQRDVDGNERRRKEKQREA